MEEVIKMVAAKAGISPENAKTAVETVVGFVKGKIPALSGQIDQLMSGGGEGGLGDIKSKLGGLFGK